MHHCTFDPKRLQHEFSNHARDFGINETWTKLNADRFQHAILNHVTDAPAIMTGTFRGITKVTHHFDPTTRLWVAVDENGQFVAGWKLSDDQVKYLYMTGNIQ